jgi:hypothetical protein
MLSRQDRQPPGAGLGSRSDGVGLVWSPTVLPLGPMSGNSSSRSLTCGSFLLLQLCPGGTDSAGKGLRLTACRRAEAGVFFLCTNEAGFMVPLRGPCETPRCVFPKHASHLLCDLDTQDLYGAHLIRV